MTPVSKPCGPFTPGTTHAVHRRASRSGNANSRGMTPTIVYGCSSSRSSLPTASGRPPNCSLPQTVREQRHAGRPARPFAFRKRTAEQRARLEQRKAAGRNGDERYAPGFAASDRHRLRSAHPAGKPIDGRRMLRPREIGAVHHGAADASDAAGARLRDAHETIGMRPRQRFEQDAVGDAEQRRRRADPQRHRQNRDGRKPRLASQQAHGIARVLDQPGTGCVASRSPAVAIPRAVSDGRSSLSRPAVLDVVSRLVGDRLAAQLLHHVERHVDAGRHAG